MASSDWGTPKAAKKEDDGGILGKVAKGLSFINPLDLGAKVATQDAGATLADELSGSENTVAKNVGSAAGFFNPAKVVPALAGGALKTGLEAARLPTSLAATAYAGATGEAAPGTSEDSPLSFLVNTEYIKNMGQDQPLANKLLANIQSGSPIIGNIGAAGGETIGRVTREAQSAASRLPGGPEMQSAEALSRGTGLEGRTYGEMLREGTGGEAILGDILSAAPVARGLAGAGARAGILSEATAGRVASATRAAEAAPLAPISLPLKAGYGAVNRAAGLSTPGQIGMSQTAFPRLAGVAERPGILGTAARVAEEGAQAVGDVWRDTAVRGRGISERAAETQAVRPALDDIETRMGEHAPSSPEYAALQAERHSLIQDIEDAADAETKFSIKRDLSRQQDVPVRNVEIPRGLDDASIDKALAGLKPKEANNFFTKAFDKVTDTWKAGVLPLNPAWQAGNVVSNSVTAMTYGDVSPLTASKNHKRVLEQMRNPTEGGGAVVGAGQAGQFDAPTGTGKVARGMQKAYDFNQMVDDYGHMQVYLNKLDQLKAQGVADDLAKAQATEFSLKTMGDFQNMSHLERNKMRRAVPFYAWSKHSAKMSAREAALRPERITQIQTRANLAGPDSTERGTEFLEGQMHLGGGRYLRLPGGMEQGAPGGLLENPLTNPLKLLGGVHPLAQVPMAAAGFNPRAGRELTKAPGQSFLSGAAGYSINQIPVIRTGADLLERNPRGFRGENVIKGDTRTAVLAGGRPIKESKEDITPLIPAPLLRFLTGAQVDKPDVEGSKKRAAKSDKKDEKSAKKYNKGAAKSAKKNN